MKPVVSIIVPAFNHEQYLADCLESVLRQTFREWECIVVDDGSTDRSGDVIRRFCEQDSRFIYHHQQNQGLSAARNRGLGLASGDLINLLDSDDALVPTALEELSTILKNSPDTIMAFCGYVGSLNTLGHVVKEVLPAFDPDKIDFFRFLAKGDMLPVHAALFRKAVTERTGLFDVSLKSCEDWDFWLRMGRVTRNIKVVKKPLVIYRMTLGSMTRKVATYFENGRVVIHRIGLEDSRVNDPLPDYRHGCPEEAGPTMKMWYMKCIGLYLAHEDIVSAGLLMTQFKNETGEELYSSDALNIWRNILIGSILIDKRKEAWKIYGSVFSEFVRDTEVLYGKPGLSNDFIKKVRYYNSPWVKRGWITLWNKVQGLKFKV